MKLYCHSSFHHYYHPWHPNYTMPTLYEEFEKQGGYLTYSGLLGNYMASLGCNYTFICFPFGNNCLVNDIPYSRTSSLRILLPYT